MLHRLSGMDGRLVASAVFKTVASALACGRVSSILTRSRNLFGAPKHWQRIKRQRMSKDFCCRFRSLRARATNLQFQAHPCYILVIVFTFCARTFFSLPVKIIFSMANLKFLAASTNVYSCNPCRAKARDKFLKRARLSIVLASTTL